MVHMKTCPLCKKENLEDAAICINCGFDLNPTFSSSTKEKPDWLETFRSEPDSSPIGSDVSNQENNSSLELDPDSPDWLSIIRDRKQKDENFENLREDFLQPAGSQTKPSGTNELIDSLRSTETNTSVPTDESENLINQLRMSDKDEQAFELQPEDDSTGTSSLPIDDDWMSRFAQVNQINELESPSSPEQDSGKRVPEWIRKHPSAKTKTPGNQENTSNPVSEWIERFGTREDQPLSSDSEDTIPDWIQPGDLEDVTSELPNAEEGIPSWLSDDSEMPYSSAQEEPSPKGPEWISEINQQSNVDASPEDILPDWITEGSENNELDSIAPQNRQADLKENENRNELQSSLKKLRENNGLPIDRKKEDNSSKLTAPPFQLDQVPNWLENNEDLINTSFFEEKETKENIELEDGATLEPGELPAWLKAMRPLEAIIPNVSASQEKKPIERSGPLAGLKGVLSSQDSTQTYAPPPMYSSTLNITEKEKIQAAILDGLFVEELDSKSQTAPKVSLSNLLVRIFVPLFLLVALGFSLFKPVNITGRPIIFPAETVRFATITNGLILNSTTAPSILVVVESEGASMAELSLLTKSVFERLMVKDSALTIVSASPNGALLGELLIGNASSKAPSYRLDERVTNLGYLPGNASGVQSFLMASQKENDIRTNMKYDAILLVIDNPDRGKLWVEQINLAAPQSIILAAATAQTIPLMIPYVASDQIDGLIGGLYGSASYAQLIQDDGSAVWKYWAMQKSAVLVFILIILVGVLYSSMNSILKIKPKSVR